LPLGPVATLEAPAEGGLPRLRFEGGPA
jgi:hypothetical protein